MYYQNYDDYMRDMFFYNQMPNQNFNYLNMGYNSNSAINNQSLNNLYPSIYRIVQPVVSRVLTGSNYQFMNEDNLNLLVDTVYNIVEGDVVNQTENDNSNSVQNSRTGANTVSSNSKNADNGQESQIILRDLIKILLIKEIINRNNIRRFNNGTIYGMQNNPNYYEERYVF